MFYRRKYSLIPIGVRNFVSIFIVKFVLTRLEIIGHSYTRHINAVCHIPSKRIISSLGIFFHHFARKVNVNDAIRTAEKSESERVIEIEIESWNALSKLKYWLSFACAHVERIRFAFMSMSSGFIGYFFAFPFCHQLRKSNESQSDIRCASFLTIMLEMLWKPIPARCHSHCWQQKPSLTKCVKDRTFLL